MGTYSGSKFPMKTTPSRAWVAEMNKKTMPHEADSPHTRFELYSNLIKNLGIEYFIIKAAEEDDRHLDFIKNEVNAGIHKGGVLISRLTIEHPASDGSYFSEYVGLQVIGFGPNSNSIGENGRYSTKCTDISKTRLCIPENREKLTGDFRHICTPENPTGSRDAKPEIRALPEGYNIGYSSMIARKLSPVISNNPENSEGGLFIHGTYVARKFIFIKQQEWIARGK